MRDRLVKFDVFGNLEQSRADVASKEMTCEDVNNELLEVCECLGALVAFADVDIYPMLLHCLLAFEDTTTLSALE
jgi:NifU-like protein involved in Fe-S cluster formation